MRQKKQVKKMDYLHAIDEGIIFERLWSLRTSNFPSTINISQNV